MLRQASGEEMRHRAQGLAAMLEGETGLQNGVDAIEEVAVQAAEPVSGQDTSQHQGYHGPPHPTQGQPFDISAPDRNDTASQEPTVSHSSVASITAVPSTPVEFPCGLAIDILPGSEVEANHIYREVFVEKVYFRHGVRVPAGGCVVDVGANVGLFALQVLQMCGGWGRFSTPLSCSPLVEVLHCRSIRLLMSFAVVRRVVRANSLCLLCALLVQFFVRMRCLDEHGMACRLASSQNHCCGATSPYLRGAVQEPGSRL